jgi:hypothetical protein
MAVSPEALIRALVMLADEEASIPHRRAQLIEKLHDAGWTDSQIDEAVEALLAEHSQ